MLRNERSVAMLAVISAVKVTQSHVKVMAKSRQNHAKSRRSGQVWLGSGRARPCLARFGQFCPALASFGRRCLRSYLVLVAIGCGFRLRFWVIFDSEGTA